MSRSIFELNRSLFSFEKENSVFFFSVYILYILLISKCIYILTERKNTLFTETLENKGLRASLLKSAFLTISKAFLGRFVRLFAIYFKKTFSPDLHAGMVCAKLCFVDLLFLAIGQVSPLLFSCTFGIHTLLPSERVCRFLPSQVPVRNQKISTRYYCV